jgi:type IV pilus assembly protein PilP
MKNNLLIIAEGIIALSLLSSCGLSESDNLKSELSALTINVKGKIEPIPIIKPYDPFEYQASDLPDPFKPTLIRSSGSGSAGKYDSEMNRKKDLLEQFPLESIKMVGTLSKISQPISALVTADDGLHKVILGNYLGQNYGRIVSISKSSIELREIMQDVSGDWSEKNTTLNIQENEGKK